jgi:hypothetical protein
VAVTFALSSASEGSILSPGVLVPLLAGLLILAVCTRVELTSAAPMVDLRLFGGRDFSIGNVAMFMAAVGFGGLLFAL